MQTFFFLLLAFTPIAIAGSKLGFPATALFFLAAIAIIPLARFIGQATEELSGRTGPAVGGLLNATFGNATELLNGTFAIRDAALTSEDRQSQVDLLSKRASGNKKQKQTDRVNGRLGGSVVVRDGKALFTPVSFQIPGATITMNGQFNLLNQHLDFHGDAKTQAELSDDTTGVKAVLLKPINSLFKKKNAGADVRVEMTGTYDKPHWGIELPVKK